MNRRIIGTALRVIALSALVTTIALMLMEPELRHQYVIGPIRVTRYALTQVLLLLVIIAEGAALVTEWRSDRRSAPKP